MEDWPELLLPQQHVKPRGIVGEEDGGIGFVGLEGDGVWGIDFITQN